MRYVYVRACNPVNNVPQSLYSREDLEKALNFLLYVINYVLKLDICIEPVRIPRIASI